MQQAARVGERLSKLKIVKILTSDLLRTKQTTENITKALKHPVDVIEHSILREREFGDLKGTPFSEVDPELFHPKSTYEPKNGEDWKSFHDRVEKAWTWIMEHAKSTLKGPDDVLVVVTHGLVKSSLASRKWGFKERILFDNTSVSTVTHAAPHSIDIINCTNHLEGLTAKL